MSTLKVSTISPLGTDATKTITIGSAGDTVAGAGANTPSFFVVKTSDQSISGDATLTKVTFDTEVFDTDSAFSDNKFTVPTNQGGKYFFSSSLRLEASGGSMDYAQVNYYKNGTRFYMPTQIQTSSNNMGTSQLNASVIFDLSASDYVEVYGAISGSSTAIGGAAAGTEENQSFFMGYKLIGA